MKLVKQPAAVQAVVLASKFAREIGLPVGNMWEPPVSRGLQKDIELHGYEATEVAWRMRLALDHPEGGDAAK